MWWFRQWMRRADARNSFVTAISTIAIHAQHVGFQVTQEKMSSDRKMSDSLCSRFDHQHAAGYLFFHTFRAECWRCRMTTRMKPKIRPKQPTGCLVWGIIFLEASNSGRWYSNWLEFLSGLLPDEILINFNIRAQIPEFLLHIPGFVHGPKVKA